MEDDGLAEEDLPVARELARTIDERRAVPVSGRSHLFADSSLPDYDEPAARLLEERVLAFLADGALAGRPCALRRSRASPTIGVP
jgi:hypothetical protein